MSAKALRITLMRVGQGSGVGEVYYGNQAFGVFC
ncbi:hypothetical protein SDC9_21157 [bioreactor metagenome]|uniref:Uncharacterized protein n=1 Tax=bioreactor metagenome TaxID=1076179 RepID=A0A644U906_9ZZZZ